MSTPLKLMAMDAEDLKIVSAHVQDSVIKSNEISYLPSLQQLTLPLNRFAWELPSSRRWFFKKHERRRSALHFSRVSSLQSRSIDRNDSDEVLSVLSVTFTKSQQPEDPSGTVEIHFSGNAALSFSVECLEVQLTDLGAAWSTANLPRHRV